MTKQDLYTYLDGEAERFAGISDAIWGYAELGFEEKQSAKLLADTLAAEGFSIESGLAGLPTAFKAVYGSGSPRIALLGEFDALPGLSQQAGVAQQCPAEGMQTGHGCGHHLLGTASAAAAIAAKRYMEATGKAGTVEFYGCPAEENASAKALLAKAGVFDGVDAALTWHPSAYNTVVNASTLANYKVNYRFKGVASHAAIAPQLGRSALDAVELMNVGANFLREHIIPEARLHYAITDTGGAAPNVVQARATVDYMLRAPQLDQVGEIYTRLNKVAEGAAMMTETEVDIQVEKTCANVISNAVLERLLDENLRAVGAPAYTQQEVEYAEAIIGSMAKKNMDLVGAVAGRAVAMELYPQTLHNGVVPYSPRQVTLPASSDVGDVSWNVPTAQFSTACFAMGTAEHTWQQVAQGKAGPAHKGMVAAAKVLAASVADLLENPAVCEAAQAEFKEVLAGREYKHIV